ncbi:kinase-like domain-containing protein [Xylaria telfairii]|nr:kinase-like domain-containing protein [Xylaria telfairii]
MQHPLLFTIHSNRSILPRSPRTMRLLDIDSLLLKEFLPEGSPPYTILSHTWGPEEVTFQDFYRGGFTKRLGFRKLQGLCDQTRRDGYRFTWIDTCCIDKSSTAELSEAINLMYRWYANAGVCYVYLSDVHYAQEEGIDLTNAIRHSRWFTRGWTLQELIAPSVVTFFDTSWNLIGTKNSLLNAISDITAIPKSCLSRERALSDFSVAVRFSWASRRLCTRREDIAYSLMGIFDVNMSLIYGEGDKAFLRLQEEIFMRIDDQSILAWGVSKEDGRFEKPSSVFAKSPADFADTVAIHRFSENAPRAPVFTNRGLSISLPLTAASFQPVSSLLRYSTVYSNCAYLNCGPDPQHAVQIILISFPLFPPTQLPPASWYRLATPLRFAERRQNLEYRDIYISIGIDSLLRTNWAIPEPEYPTLADSFKDKGLADFSTIKDKVTSRESNLEAIVDVLNEEMVFNIDGKSFLPEGALNKVLDEDIMLRLLQDLLQPADSTPELVPLILPRCRKTFAILLLSGLLRFFRTMVEKLEISDECLPMPDLQCLFDPTLVIGTQNAEHLRKWKLVASIFGRKEYARIFFDIQWRVLAPIFRGNNNIQHYPLSQYHILPFVQSESHLPRQGAGYSTTSYPKFGGYGEIRKVSIHPDHYDFGPLSGKDSMDNPRNFFAVKELRGTNRKAFEIEKHALERFRKPDALHILQLLATYEVRVNYTDYIPTTYNMLFPWADSNLKEFWASDQYVRDETIVPWIAEQCWKLADALKAIHVGYMDTASDYEPEQFYGIHGDIKPANILRFPADQVDTLENLGRLVIGDFGLTHFHRESSRSIIRSSSVSFSATYSAPEFVVERRISRKADVWALGCVYLEFITWFLTGPESVNHTFPKLRIDADTVLVIPSDRFFQATSHLDGRPPLALVKPVVLRWVDDLYKSDGCSRFFKHFLDLIRSEILTVDPHERIQAEELSWKLEEMYHKCLYQPHYYRGDMGLGKPAKENDTATSGTRKKKKKWPFCFPQRWYHPSRS